MARKSRQFQAIVAAGIGLGVLELGFGPSPASATDWTVTLGAEARVQPSFEGSDSYVLRPIPLIDIRRAGTPRRFQSPRDGASIGLFENGSFRAGLTGKIKFPRDQDDDINKLRGLGDVDWAIEPGVFVEYWPVNWLRTRAELRQGFGGHHGQLADLSADLVFAVTPQLTLSAGPRVGFASASALDPYFGVTPAQSAASGLPVYSPDGGLHGYGFGGQARYEWSSKWATHFYFEFDRLAGGAADAPLVTLRGTPNQIQVGFGVTYSFDVGLF